MKQIEDLAESIFSDIVSLRREIHQYPELEFQETRTAGLICKTLDRWGIPYQQNIAKTGIVVNIFGKQPGKTILLRADMDALPITEDTGLPYSSKIPGLMHACGHDAHVAILLGAAYLLQRLCDSFSGCAKLVFQPAEEGLGGAQPMIAEGVMEHPKVDAAVALHVTNAVLSGQIYIKDGPVTASPDDFDIIIKGRGGHGGTPHLNVDPILIAAQFVTCLQTVASRNIPPAKPVAISVNSIHGGVNYNVVPDQVEIKGTARCADPDIRKQLPALIEQMVRGITAAHGAEYEFVFHPMFPPASNDIKMNRTVIAAAEKIIGRKNIIFYNEPAMTGDDFAYFAELVPATYFHLGISNPSKGITYPIHSNHFQIDESALKTGYQILVQTVLDYLS